MTFGSTQLGVLSEAASCSVLRILPLLPVLAVRTAVLIDWDSSTGYIKQQYWLYGTGETDNCVLRSGLLPGKKRTVASIC